MRALVVAGLAAVGIGLGIWLLRTHDTVLDPSTKSVPIAATPPAPHESAALSDRAVATAPHASIVGSVLAPTGEPVAGATVRVVIDEPRDDLPLARTDARGRYQLLGVPLAVVAVRVEAPGRVGVQLGDLHPENAPEHHLDLPPFQLAAGVTIHGQVRSAGRGLAGAQLILAAELGAPGMPQPVVQRVLSDEQGWFLFDAAPATAGLLQARASGHREMPPMQLTDVQSSLQIELVPLPHLRGRVVDAASGVALPHARVWAAPLGEGAALPLRVRPDADAAAGSTVADDGTFDVVCPDRPQVALEVAEPSHVARLLGPFAGDAVPAEQLIALRPGCIVRATVTWHDDPIDGIAGLWPLDGRGEPIVAGSFDRSTALQLPPAPPGSWLLRIDARQGSRFERTVRLDLPGPLELPVAIGDGTRLVGTVRGATAGPTTILCMHETGRNQLGFARADGSFEVPNLFPGRWRAYAIARDGTMLETALVSMVPLLDDAGFAVPEIAELRRDLVPSLELFASLRGQLAPQCAGATIELLAGNATQARVPPMLLRTRVGDDGSFRLQPVLPGTWRVRLTTSGHAPRECEVIAVAGSACDAIFPD